MSCCRTSGERQSGGGHAGTGVVDCRRAYCAPKRALTYRRGGKTPTGLVVGSCSQFHGESKLAFYGSTPRTQKLPRSLGQLGESLRKRHEPGLLRCPSGFFKFLSTGLDEPARIALPPGSPMWYRIALRTRGKTCRPPPRAPA